MHGGDRVFKGSEVDLTSRRRYEGHKKKKKSRTKCIPSAKFRIFDRTEDREYISIVIFVKKKIFFNYNVIINLFIKKKAQFRVKN